MITSQGGKKCSVLLELIQDGVISEYHYPGST